MRLCFLLLLSLFAGCLTDPADSGTVGEPEPATRTQSTISGDGRSEGMACVDLPTGRTCRFFEGSTDVQLNQPDITLIEATFTWQNSDPTKQIMRAYLLSYDDQDNWSWEESPNTFASGTSPLTVSWNVTSLPTPAYYTLHMNTGARGANGEYAVDTGTTWHVEATVHHAHG